MDATRDFLRHTVATLAYRAGKALRNTPDHAATFRCGETSRTPVEILAHIGDLLDWALALADGEHRWHDATPGAWDDEVRRFFDALARLDARLASERPLGSDAGRLFQGPIADAFTHVGQIAMLRRLAGAPVKGENYFKADIVVGRVGSEQSAPKRELD
jgi:hypothetical protein